MAAADAMIRDNLERTPFCVTNGEIMRNAEGMDIFTSAMDLCLCQNSLYSSIGTLKDHGPVAGYLHLVLLTELTDSRGIG